MRRERLDGMVYIFMKSKEGPMMKAYQSFGRRLLDCVRMQALAYSVWWRGPGMSYRWRKKGQGVSCQFEESVSCGSSL